MYEWQGLPGKDGDCDARSPDGGWACTLSAGHQRLHEAWGTHGTEPIYAWGSVREDDLAMQMDAGEEAPDIRHNHLTAVIDEQCPKCRRDWPEYL